MKTEAIWNVFEIGAMTEAQQVRNLCRQLRQECEWGRCFSFQRRPVRRWQELPKSITLLCGGGRGKQWVQVERDHNPVSAKLDPRADEALYLAIMAEAENKPQPVYCPICRDTCVDQNDPTGQADCGSCGGSFAWRQREEFYKQQKTA